MKQWDIRVSWKPSTQSKNIIDGQECEHLSSNMYRDVESVNNSRLTEIRLIPLIFQLKDQSQ